MFYLLGFLNDNGHSYFVKSLFNLVNSASNSSKLSFKVSGVTDMLVGLNQGVRFYIQSQSHLFSGQVHILVRVEMMVDHIDDGGDGRPVWWGVSLNKAEYIYIWQCQ